MLCGSSTTPLPYWISSCNNDTSNCTQIEYRVPLHDLHSTYRCVWHPIFQGRIPLPSLSIATTGNVGNCVRCDDEYPVRHPSFALRHVHIERGARSMYFNATNSSAHRASTRKQWLWIARHGNAPLHMGVAHLHGDHLYSWCSLPV